MKKTAYYYLSLAAIVAGGLVSCQDDDRGFTTEDVKASVYQKEFIKTYGAPAKNHQWGFDASPFYYAEMSSSSSYTRALTRAESLPFLETSRENFMKKANEIYPTGNPQNTHVQDFFELPAIITPKERQEVYYWFSHHKVNWESDDPTNCLDEHSRDCDHIAHEYLGDETSLDYGSLSAYAGDASMETEFKVNWAWIQHVANDPEQDEYRWDYSTQSTTTKESSAIGTSMSHLCFRLTEDATYKSWVSGQQVDVPCGNQYMHMDSFNGGKGPGDETRLTGPEAALFLLQTNFNDLIYQCCGGNGGSYHNKYYIVYLKGDGYEGYYLGMDYEGDGQSNTNQCVKANGICNDWIIKLNVPYAKIHSDEDRRIMCEDLGGLYDYDFNDIVLDVTHDSHDASGKRKALKIELKALGGTLPVYVTYDNTPLWGADDLHKKLSGVGVPVNVTNGGLDNSLNNAVINKNILTAFIGSTYGGNDPSYANPVYTTDQKLDYNKIHIFIIPEGKAEWIQLDNYNKETPLKLCVPQTVKWAIECAAKPGTQKDPKDSEEAYNNAGRSIGSAYPSFMEWVRDPTTQFWGRSNIVEKYLFDETQLNN